VVSLIAFMALLVWAHDHFAIVVDE
jgi:hypothetical protein